MALINPAKGADTKVNYIVETTPGTTPATPTMIQLPFTKADIDFVQTTIDDTTIYADRQEHFVIAGPRKVTGSLSGNLSHTNFNALIQTLMSAAPVSKVYKTGTVLQTITLEKWHADINVGFVSTGCFVDKFALKMPASGVCTFDATINGVNMTTESTPLSGSPTAPVSEAPFTLVSATIQEGGSTIAYVSAVDATIDNKAQALDVIGQQVPAGYVLGMSKISGSLAAYLVDSTLYAKYNGQTGSSLSIVLSDGTNTVTFLFPNITYTGVKMPIQGQGAVTQTLSFTAQKDPTAQSNVVITVS
jgi:Phage tail tube protein